jgi:glycosyltransferase involved in cell wall biosynthesis
VKIAAVILAYNEEQTIGDVVRGALRHVDEVLVVDDGSTDQTSQVAERAGARIIKHDKNKGVLEALKTGVRAADSDVVVTLDADGQYSPTDISRLIEPVLEGKADLVLGVRDRVPHRSERVITSLVALSVKCSDAGTGFRAIRGELAKKMKLYGSCPCGTFVLEAHKHNARIAEIPVHAKPRVYGKRKIRTRHVKQFFYVLMCLVLK